MRLTSVRSSYSPRKALKLAAIVAAMILPAACSLERTADSGSGLTYDRNIEQLRAMPTSDIPFNAELAKHYKVMAERQAGWREDFIDADYFARKGIKAAAGEAVFPEESSYWNLSSEDANRVNNERQKLMDLLDAGARRNIPVAAAAAQARFDCWVEALEPGETEQDADFCYKGFQTLTNNLHAQLTRPQGQMRPAGPPTQRLVVRPGAPQGPQRYLYMILFDFDQSVLSSEALTKLREVAITQQKWPNSKVLVVGHTDAAGSQEYNIALSQRRTDAVINALIDAGANPNRITATWSGEANPAVARPDGQREPANRRVMVVLDEAGRF